MNIKAIFKGKDGSMGYKYGMEYRLHLCNINDEKMSVISLSGGIGGEYCEYSNFISFLNNWDDIRKID